MSRVDSYLYILYIIKVKDKCINDNMEKLKEKENNSWSFETDFVHFHQ